VGKAVFLASFGAQTLKDGTDFKQKSVDDGGDVPRTSLYETIDGSWFDAAASGANTLVPGTVSCEIAVTGSSDANFKTNTNLIDALNGTKATLTGTYADATTVTCTARCTVGSVSINTSSHLIPVAFYRLSFQKTTSWA